MHPIILKGKILDGEIVTSESTKDLAEMIASGNIIVIKEVYNQKD